MKLAITAKGTDLNAQVDPRFGRAQYILIVNDSGELAEVVNNSDNVNAMGGAGIQAAKLVADKGVDALVTGNCGPNAFKALNAAGVKVIVEESGTVRDSLERVKRNEVKYASEPNVEGHW